MNFWRVWDDCVLKSSISNTKKVQFLGNFTEKRSYFQYKAIFRHWKLEIRLSNENQSIGNVQNNILWTFDVSGTTVWWNQASQTQNKTFILMKVHQNKNLICGTVFFFSLNTNFWTFLQIRVDWKCAEEYFSNLWRICSGVVTVNRCWSAKETKFFKSRCRKLTVWG